MLAHEFAKSSVLERPVIIIGPKGDYQSQWTVLLFSGYKKAVQEMAPLFFVLYQREKFLKLVDDQEELALMIRQGSADRPQ
jgi:hypothetical protein